MKYLRSAEYERLLEEFIFYLEVTGYAPATITTRRRNIQEFLLFLEEQKTENINCLTKNNLTAFLRLQQTRENKQYGAGLSLSSINQYGRSIKRFLEFLSDYKQIPVPEIEIIFEDDRPEERTTLTPEEINDLYNATYLYIKLCRFPRFHATRSRAMLALYYGCGLRKSEAINLNMKDVQIDNRLIHIRKGKGGRERYVPFTAPTGQFLSEYAFARSEYLQSIEKEREAFLISEQGERCGELTLSKMLQKLIKRTGNPCLIQKKPSLHTLRHSIATHLLQQGMDIEYIRRFLGHKSLDTTQIYTHLINEG
jgi:integrase/recombinase XerD